MTDRELEMRVQQAFDAAAPDIFDSVMAECSAPRGKVVALTKSRKKKSGFAKRLLSIAAVMPPVARMSTDRRTPSHRS